MRRRPRRATPQGASFSSRTTLAAARATSATRAGRGTHRTPRARTRQRGDEDAGGCWRAGGEGLPEPWRWGAWAVTSGGETSTYVSVTYGAVGYAGPHEPGEHRTPEPRVGRVIGRHRRD